MWEWPPIIFRVATARKCYCRKQNAVSAFGQEHYTLRIDAGCKMCKILRTNKLFFLPEMLTSTPFTWKGTMKLSEHVVSSGAFSHYFHGQAHKKILSINFSFFSRFSGGDRTRHVSCNWCFHKWRKQIWLSVVLKSVEKRIISLFGRQPPPWLSVRGHLKPSDQIEEEWRTFLKNSPLSLT